LTIIGVVMYFHMEGVKETILRPGAWSIRVEIWEQTLARVREALFFGEGISTDRGFILSDGSTWNHSRNTCWGMGAYFILSSTKGGHVCGHDCICLRVHDVR
jgi:hypothetical protein